METRLITGKDVALLAALHKDCFVSGRWSAAQLSGSLDLPTTVGFIAEADRQAAGFILCQMTPDEEAEVLTICVKPALRRKGIGAVLLNSAFAAARERKAARLFLEVAADNAAAIALYEKTGFRAIGTRSGYYARAGGAVDAVVMETGIS